MRNKPVDGLMDFLRANGKTPWITHGGKHIKVHWIGRPGCTRMIPCPYSPTGDREGPQYRALARRYLRQDQVV